MTRQTLMPRARIVVLTALALLAFAGNSLLCRLALNNRGIDPASFTSIRLVSGAVALSLLVHWRGGTRPGGGSWISACALFAYAAAFSFAYVDLAAGTGALLLFGAVQATMIGHALYRGERLRMVQLLGLLLALGGLVTLVYPGLSAPPPLACALMLASGAAWGVYSLRGKYAGDPLRGTAENFLRAVPFTLLLTAMTLRGAAVDPVGACFALVSGVVTSALGYAIWYTALEGLSSAQAASVQLSVPIIAALGGVALLGEAFTLRLVLAAIAILGGIALVTTAGRSR